MLLGRQPPRDLQQKRICSTTTLTAFPVTCKVNFLSTLYCCCHHWQTFQEWFIVSNTQHIDCAERALKILFVIT